MNYKIFLIDGGFVSAKGIVTVADGAFCFYGEDKVMSLIVPINQVRYIDVN